MSLTNTERLILANQYEILGDLRKNPYYHKLAEYLRKGYEGFYADELNTILPLFKESGFVYTILELYEILKHSYDKLPDDEKAQIEVYKVTFHGFGGNNEHEYLDFIHELKEQGRFNCTSPDLI